MRRLISQATCCACASKDPVTTEAFNAAQRDVYACRPLTAAGIEASSNYSQQRIWVVLSGKGPMTKLP